MIKNIIEQFVFFPNKKLEKTPNNLGIQFENIYLYLDEKKIHGWYIKNNLNTNKKILKNKIILFCHGNAGNISFRLNYIKIFYEIGFSLMFFDYPGFGLSEGLPNEENCIKSGHLFYLFLINKKKYNHSDIIFYGESIGGSIVTCLANKLNAKYLILQSTFTDIKKIIKKLILGNYINIVVDQIGFETLNYLKKRYKMNLIEKKMKTMIIHSYDDEIIDVSNAKELSSYSDDLVICEGSHSNIKIDNELIFKIIDFIEK